MMSDTGSWWICPSCGMRNNAIDPTCSNCRGATTIRHQRAPAAPKAAIDPASITFPLTLLEARFCLTLPAGPQWTSGSVHATENGIYMLSDNDKIQPATLTSDPTVWTLVGALSAYAPKAEIKRIVNSKTLGQAFETKTLRIALRLPADGWARLAAVCVRLGIAQQ